MSDYGVLPQGFRRKELSQILAEIEAAMATELGPDVIQSPQSPLGQLNALFADLTAQLWEIGEDVYQSYDPDQAEGARLDSLARIRILARGAGESDESLRQAVTNAGRARIDIQDLARAIRAVAGVTYARVVVNDNDASTEFGLDPGSVAVAALGGDDQDIAAQMRRYIAPGVTTWGDNVVTSEIDGFCRSFRLVRPILVPVTLSLTVRRRADRLGCPPPSGIAIRDALVSDLTATILNGDDVTTFRLQQALYARWGGQVELVTWMGERDGLPGDAGAVGIGFVEMATFAADDTTITDAP